MNCEFLSLTCRDRLEVWYDSWFDGILFCCVLYLRSGVVIIVCSDCFVLDFWWNTAAMMPELTSSTGNSAMRLFYRALCWLDAEVTFDWPQIDIETTSQIRILHPKCHFSFLLRASMPWTAFIAPCGLAIERQLTCFMILYKDRKKWHYWYWQ